MKKKLLVVGASGKMGRYILNELTNSPHSIRTLVRSGSVFPDQLSAWVEVIEGSLNDFAQLESAMEGVQGVLLNFPRCWNCQTDKCRLYLEGLKNLIVLARIHKVEHIVAHIAPVPEGLAAEKDLFSFYRKGRELLQLASVPLTTIQATLFMETFPELLQKGRKVRVLAEMQKPIHWLSVRDLGKQVAQIFFDADYFNKTIQMKGPEALTLEDAAQKFISGQSSEQLLRLQAVTLNAMRFWSLVRGSGQEDLAWFAFIRQYSEECLSLESDDSTTDFLRFSDFLKLQKLSFNKEKSSVPALSS